MNYTMMLSEVEARQAELRELTDGPHVHTVHHPHRRWTNAVRRLLG